MKIINKSLVLLLIINVIFFGLIASNTPNDQSFPTQQQEPEVLFWKNVNVVITKISKDYAFKGNYVATVTAKSDEYGLEKTFTIRGSTFNGDAYIEDIFYDRLKVGDTIKAEMYSWKRGQTVTRRELYRLVK